MRFGLTARVVTTVVALAVGVVAVDALVTRWAFQARFLSYVSEQERDSLERLAETMAAFHDEEGSLSGLSEPHTMLRVLRRAFVAESRRGSRRMHTNWDNAPSDVPRLTVTLADGTEVLSASEGLPAHAERIQRAVEVDGAIIATLTLVPARELARERDQRFVRDHFAAIAWIAAAAAAVASIVGFLLARRTIVPIQAVAAGARTLADGRYDLVLEASRSDEIGGLARDFNSLARTLEATAEARALGR